MATPVIEAQRLYVYQNDTDVARTVIATASDATGVESVTNNVGYWSAASTFTSIFVPSSGASTVEGVCSRDWMYFVDGLNSDCQKWDLDYGVQIWGIVAPLSSELMTISDNYTGVINLNIGRVYYYAYYNSVTGNYSDLSQPSPSSGPVVNKELQLTNIYPSSDPQVTGMVLLATADGGDPSILYFVATLAADATNYLDNTTETDLLLAPVYQETDTSGLTSGLLGNEPPPASGKFPTKWNGRLWLVQDQFLRFSKSLAEVITSTGVIAGRYEEDWPSYNSIDVSEGAETIHGLLAGGSTLYVGTELHIRSMTGNDATTFSQPVIVFNDVGLLNQPVWQTVFLEGTPVGAMWLTPDLRCIGSDFNTYQDVGTPIQSTLNSINPAALNNCWAQFTSNGPYNFYILAIPTGANTVPDTLCVYDLRGHKWYIWQLYDQLSAGLFYLSYTGIPRFMFTDASGDIWAFDTTTTWDRNLDVTATGITTILTTSFLDLGDPTIHKTLNEVEVGTSLSGMLVSVSGASMPSSYGSPNTVLSPTALSVSPFGQYKVYLNGAPATDRMYQFSFSATSDNNSTTSDIFLDLFSTQVKPLHRY